MRRLSIYTLNLEFGAEKGVSDLTPSPSHALGIPLLQTAQVDQKALIFTLAIGCWAGLFFAIAPARQLSAPDLHEILEEATRGSTEARRHSWMREILVVSEIALA